MHLRTLIIKGFKSFPDRTRLESRFARFERAAA